MASPRAHAIGVLVAASWLMFASIVANWDALRAGVNDITGFVDWVAYIGLIDDALSLGLVLGLLGIPLVIPVAVLTFVNLVHPQPRCDRRHPHRRGGQGGLPGVPRARASHRERS